MSTAKNGTPRLDERDIKILSILQREGRLSKAALAERVNLSSTPCWERLHRLEQAGIIESYGAQISLKAFGPVTVVFVEISIENHRAEDFQRFEQAIAGDAGNHRMLGGRRRHRLSVQGRRAPPRRLSGR